MKEYNRFIYDLHNPEGKSFNTLMKVCTALPNIEGPYRVGSIFSLPLGVLEQNNRLGLCDCEVVTLEKINHQNYRAFIRKLEFWENRSHVKNSIDWDGLDGWLSI